MPLILKTNFLFRSRMSWSKIRAILRGCLSWIASQGIIKLRCTLKIKAHIFKDAFGSIRYTVMPFGLKNAGAIYQRAMNAIFHEHIRKTVEFYVDDIAVKSRDKGDYLTYLKRVFNIMRAHQMKMNPTMSFLGVASGKFLWIYRWIQRNSLGFAEDLCRSRDATSENFKELRGLHGQLGIHPEIYIKSLRMMPTLH